MINPNKMVRASDLKPLTATTATNSLTLSAFDDPAVWLRSPLHDAPLRASEVEIVQREIDSIVGTTRDNKSIVKLVWNGDRAFWKQFHTDWNAFGHPRGEILRRPFVLYKTIVDKNDKLVRDAFPPRWLLLTRIEPEQYQGTWARDTKIFCPERGVQIQLLPETPPKDYYLWFQTIARHSELCCPTAAANGVECYGLYTHPRAALDNLRDIRKGMENSNFRASSSPFDAPDDFARKVRNNSTNNYEEQAMRRVIAQKTFLVDSLPLALAPMELLERKAPLSRIRAEITETAKRRIDVIANKFKRK
jgi:hypothetical protein